VESIDDRNRTIEALVAGRTFGSGISIMDGPILSVKDLALCESLHSFSLGLFLATILTSYAACEMFLVERLGSLRMLHSMDVTQWTPHEAERAWTQAMESSESELRSIGVILESCRSEGAWLPKELRDRIQTLAKWKNDYSHFRRNGDPDFDAAGASGITGRIIPGNLLEHQTLRERGEQALATVLDLWFLPVVSYMSGHEPPVGWSPLDEPYGSQEWVE